MGYQKVPFGHQGFNQRAKDMPFPKKGAGENVAYIGNHPRAQIPKVKSFNFKAIVDGWINSPGHRKNLLGDWHLCTIAAFKTPAGLWYFTQLFAKTV